MCIAIKVHRKPVIGNVSILVKEESEVQRLRWLSWNAHSSLLVYDLSTKSLSYKLKNLTSGTIKQNETASHL